MSKEITLPSGNTVKLREPKSLLKKDRDTVIEMMSYASNDLMQELKAQDGIVAVSVIEWSFDLIPPSIRLASLGELSPADFDALTKECQAAAEYLFPALFASKETEADPKADTANSND